MHFYWLRAWQWKRLALLPLVGGAQRAGDLSRGPPEKLGDRTRFARFESRTWSIPNQGMCLSNE
jgi:hypothetical protein